MMDISIKPATWGSAAFGVVSEVDGADEVAVVTCDTGVGVE